MTLPQISALPHSCAAIGLYRFTEQMSIFSPADVFIKNNLTLSLYVVLIKKLITLEKWDEKSHRHY
jgi:hypothetical protein